MDKEKFLAALDAASPEIDIALIKKTIRDCTDACSAAEPQYPRGHRNLIIAAEELSELGQQTCKLLRGTGDKNALIEELADVYLAGLYIKEIGNISDEELNKAINVKIQRVRDRITADGWYQ